MLVAPADGRPPPCDLWAGSWPDCLTNGPGARPLPSGKPLWSWSHMGTSSVLPRAPSPATAGPSQDKAPPAGLGISAHQPRPGLPLLFLEQQPPPVPHLCSLALVCHTTMTYTKGSMDMCSFQRPTNAPAPPPSYPRGCSSRPPALLAAAHSQISRWSLSFFQVVLPVAHPQTAVCGLSVCVWGPGRPLLVQWRPPPWCSVRVSVPFPLSTHVSLSCGHLSLAWPQPQCSLACSRC